MLGQKRSVKFLPVKVVGKGVERKLSHRQIYGLPSSVFQNKDSPDYKPNYGKKFTERQLKIPFFLLFIRQIGKDRNLLVTCSVFDLINAIGSDHSCGSAKEGGTVINNGRRRHICVLFLPDNFFCPRFCDISCPSTSQMPKEGLRTQPGERVSFF